MTGESGDLTSNSPTTKQLLLTLLSVLMPAVSPGEELTSTERRSRINPFAGAWLRKPEPLGRQRR